MGTTASRWLTKLLNKLQLDCVLFFFFFSFFWVIFQLLLDAPILRITDVVIVSL